MICPICGGELCVNRTRDLKFRVERNRYCPICRNYTDTVEVKKDEYDRLINGVPNDESECS